MMELPKEKRPPDIILWDGSSSELEDWLDRVFGKKEKADGLNLVISDLEIEG